MPGEPCIVRPTGRILSLLPMLRIFQSTHGNFVFRDRSVLGRRLQRDTPHAPTNIGQLTVPGQYQIFLTVASCVYGVTFRTVYTCRRAMNVLYTGNFAYPFSLSLYCSVLLVLVGLDIQISHGLLCRCADIFQFPLARILCHIKRPPAATIVDVAAGETVIRHFSIDLI